MPLDEAPLMAALPGCVASVRLAGHSEDELWSARACDAAMHASSVVDRAAQEPLGQQRARAGATMLHSVSLFEVEAQVGGLALCLHAG